HVTGVQAWALRIYCCRNPLARSAAPCPGWWGSKASTSRTCPPNGKPNGRNGSSQPRCVAPTKFETTGLTMAAPATAEPAVTANDSEVVQALYARFGRNTFVLQPTGDGMPTLWVPRDQLLEVLRFLKELPRPYVMLHDLSAMDERLRQHRDGLPPADFTVFYQLLSLERNADIRIKVALTLDSLWVPTITKLWPNANWYERELWDMFGIEVKGHPLLVRILMPRTWKGHPLRKDHPARATEFDPFLLDAARQDAE